MAAYLDDHRVCFVGDSFVQGTCDPEYLGWVGRISAEARAYGYAVTAYNLGVRRDTSDDIALRWKKECESRLPVECSRYVLFSFGANDMTYEKGQLRVSMADSVANFSRILSSAKDLYNTLVVGPAPVGAPEQDDRILALCDAYRRRAMEMGVSYLAIAETLAKNTAWAQEIYINDGSHPGARGYQFLADLISAWPAWWFQSDSGLGHQGATAGYAQGASNLLPGRSSFAGLDIEFD